MQSSKIIFRNGKFRDQVSGAFLLPEEGVTYTIVGEQLSFAEARIIPPTVKNTEAKRLWAQKKFGDCSVLVLTAGTLLYYRIGVPKIFPQEYAHEYLFEARLLEDLYLYAMQRKELAQPHNWRIAECQCENIACLYGMKSDSEDPVKAKSLNELFGLTVQRYFNGLRSTGCDVYNTFFQHAKGQQLTVEAARKPVASLDGLRVLAVRNFETRQS